MPGRVNKILNYFKHIYSTFQSISVQTHQSLMLIDFNFAKIGKHPDRPPLVAFACSTVSQLQVKIQLVRTGHLIIMALSLVFDACLQHVSHSDCQTMLAASLIFGNVFTKSLISGNVPCIQECPLLVFCAWFTIYVSAHFQIMSTATIKLLHHFGLVCALILGYAFMFFIPLMQNM